MNLQNLVDRFVIFEALLTPLEEVKQNPQKHPEGDVLYHSLQVFDHARDEAPYDEELLLAALLHDVGKGIDKEAHEAAALAALNGYISERTAWLIENHTAANMYRRRELGSRASRRLAAHEWFDDVMLLSECDQAGREAGVHAPDVEEALEYIRGLEDNYE